MLTNSYNLTYYGTKYWEWEEEAVEQLDQYLVGQGEEAPEEWAAFEVEEGVLKRYNVKLKNDSKLLLFVDGAGQAVIRLRDQ
jgi:hypothetical protein